MLSSMCSFKVLKFNFNYICLIWNQDNNTTYNNYYEHQIYNWEVKVEKKNFPKIIHRKNTNKIKLQKWSNCLREIPINVLQSKHK